MNTMNAVVWILPIIFMLHDFEEIIMIGSWKTRYKAQLDRLKEGSRRDLMSTKVPYKDFRSAASFSVAVLIIFFGLSFISLLSCLFCSYFIWFGVCSAFVIHCMIHFKMCIQLKSYVPGISTAAISLPIGILLLWYAAVTLNFTFFTVVSSVFIGLLTVVAALVGLHACMTTFELWLTAYADCQEK